MRDAANQKFDLAPDLRAALASVRSVGVITGAGISAESGIATYRGKGGIYDDPEQGDQTINALTGDSMRDDPARTWAVLRTIARSASTASPNAAHEALVALESHVQAFTLLTQNVDGLHGRAGQRHMIEIHGNAFDLRCTSCAWHSVGAARAYMLGDTSTLGDAGQPGDTGALPLCAHCGAPARPDVVLFGEMLDPSKLGQLHQHFYEDTLDLLLIIGTSALFPYIVNPVVVANQRRTLSIEVNPEPTDLSRRVDHHLMVGAGTGVPALVQAIICGD